MDRRVTNIYEIRSPLTESEWEAYFQLRWQILRQPWEQPPGSEKDDLEESAIHRCAIAGNKLIGVGRLHTLNERQAQIRYMATAPDFRKQGVATAILRCLEQEAQRAGVVEIILNAREQYLDFYLGLGYTIVGDAPTLYSTIKHKRLKKAVTGPIHA